MGIDLGALAREADGGEGDVVVTRRWLKQVHTELQRARALPPFSDPPVLDHVPNHFPAWPTR